jgi:hypothetical protein
MLHYKKRGEKFVYYWENDLNFRSQFMRSSYNFTFDSFFIKGYYDLHFQKTEFQALNEGLNNNNTEWGREQNIYFNNLGKSLCLNGVIQKFQEIVSFSKIKSSLYFEIYQNDKLNAFCSKDEFFSYYSGMIGDKWIKRNEYYQAEWLLNFAAYERYLKEKNVKRY